MKIGLFADAHDSCLEVSCQTRRPILSRGKMRQAMAAFAGCDLAICLGDLVDECGSVAANAAWLRDTADLLKGFGLPFLCMMGNHDYTNFSKADFERISGLTVPPFSMRFGHRELVFLDANCFQDGSCYGPGHVEWTNAIVPQDQLDALDRLLKTTDARDVYVFAHQNLDPNVESRHIIRNAEAVRRMIAESGKVRAVYQGHYHPGCESVIDGIPYHTLPAMVEGEGNAYRIIEI